MTRTVGTSDEVVAAFVAGRPLRTRSAKVPGGCRVSAHAEPDGTVLYSYRTAIAVRRPDGTVAVGLRRYSVTTSKLQGHVRGALSRAGYRPVRAWDAVPAEATGGDHGPEMPEMLTTIHAAVPGRWGGWGPAWHATGWENVPAEVWSR